MANDNEPMGTLAAPVIARKGVNEGLGRILASPVARKALIASGVALAALLGVEVSPELRAALESVLAIMALGVTP